MGSGAGSVLFWDFKDRPTGSPTDRTGNRDSYPPARQSARRRRMAAAVNECGPRLTGPRHL